MQIKLERATVVHVEDYIRIEKKIESRTYLAITDPDEALRSMEMSITYAIRKDLRIVGFIGYERKSFDHVNIIQVAVDPDFQRRGIAGEALRLVLSELEHTERIDLETHPENPARYLYESHGFIVEGHIGNYHESGEPRLVMVRYGNGINS